MYLKRWQVCIVLDFANFELLGQMTKRLQKTLESTRFAGSPIAAVAAKPSGTEVRF